MAKRIFEEMLGNGVLVQGTEYGGSRFFEIADVINKANVVVVGEFYSTPDKFPSEATVIRISEKAIQTMKPAFKFNDADINIQVGYPLITVEEGFGCNTDIKTPVPKATEPGNVNAGKKYPKWTEDGTTVRISSIKYGKGHQYQGDHTVSPNAKDVAAEVGVELKNK